MALFGRKKKAAEEAVNQTQNENKESEQSTLDLIKEAMAEAKEERANQAAGDMPTDEEIRHAQEIIARAQQAAGDAPMQEAPVSNGKTGVNAPFNTNNLKALINNFIQNKTQDNMQKIMACLQNPKVLVTVPAQIITSKENQEKLKQGGNVQLEGPVHINPMILTDNKGQKVFPMFSGEDMVPQELVKKMPKVNMPFGQCLNIMRNMKDINTFVLDPYTANIRIGVNIEEKK